ncbi:MAG: hypothetical protein ACYCZH_07900 [Sulfuriferula sp.]
MPTLIRWFAHVTGTGVGPFDRNAPAVLGKDMSISPNFVFDSGSRPNGIGSRILKINPLEWIEIWILKL